MKKISSLQKIIDKNSGDYKKAVDEYIKTKEYTEFKRTVEEKALLAINKKESLSELQKKWMKQFEKKNKKTDLLFREMDKKYFKLVKLGLDEPKIDKGTKLTKNVLKNILDSKLIQGEIASIRSRYKIPITGVEQGNWPSEIISSTGWNDFLNDCSRIDKEHFFSIKLGAQFVWSYILYGEKNFDKYLVINSISSAYCKFIDFNDDIFLRDELKFKSEIESEIQNFPIGIMISPAVSEQILIDYIHKVYKTVIEPHQKYYGKNENKLLIHKKRGKKIERDKFIYKNRNLGYHKIFELVSRLYGDQIDPGLFRKIVSLQNKKV